MSHAAGDGECEGGRLAFERRVRVEFHGSTITWGMSAGSFSETLVVV